MGRVQEQTVQLPEGTSTVEDGGAWVPTGALEIQRLAIGRNSFVVITSCNRRSCWKVKGVCLMLKKDVQHAKLKMAWFPES